MSEEKASGGITIKELKEFLNKLPIEFDECSMVNGEVVQLQDDIYARVDKPVVTLQIDEENREFLILHQSQEQLDTIMKDVNGDTKES